HKLWKKSRGRGANESDREPSDVAPCGSARSLNGQFGLCEREYSFGVKHLAFRRELCAALRTRKQLQPKFVFEVGDCLADRRLGNVDTAGRFTKNFSFKNRGGKNKGKE